MNLVQQEDASQDPGGPTLSSHLGFEGTLGAACTITINGLRKEKVRAGVSLLFALWSRKIFIPSLCGGQAKCGRCKVKVVKGGGERLPAEEPLLTPEEKSQGIRLACQVQVTGDIEISVPEELISPRKVLPQEGARGAT